MSTLLSMTAQTTRPSDGRCYGQSLWRWFVKAIGQAS